RSSGPWLSGRSLLYVQQLHVELERRVRRDRAREAARAVGEVRRDQQLAAAADLHARDALVPALDHPPLAERERERLPAVARAVELLSVEEPARVVDEDGLPGLRARALAHLEVLPLEPRCALLILVGHGRLLRRARVRARRGRARGRRARRARRAR